MKKIINIMIWPVLYGIGQFTIAFIFTLIYNAKLNMNYDELVKYMDTTKYKEELANYLIDNKILIVLIGVLIFLPLFFKKYNLYKTNYVNKVDKMNIPLFIIIGMTYCLLLNLVFYLIGYYTDFITINSSKIVLNILIINIITTVIIGPIIEEYLFRGIVYNRIKKHNIKNPYVISSLVFALFHLDLLTMFYAFIFNMVLVYLYEKYQSIKVPIIVHMSANLTTLVILPFVINLNIIFVWTFFIATVIIIYFFFKRVSHR